MTIFTVSKDIIQLDRFSQKSCREMTVGKGRGFFFCKEGDPGQSRMETAVNYNRFLWELSDLNWTDDTVAQGIIPGALQVLWAVCFPAWCKLIFSRSIFSLSIGNLD